MEKCLGCRGCALAQVGCELQEASRTKSSASGAQRSASGAQEDHKAAAACNMTCPMGGEEVACGVLVQLAADRGFGDELDACDRGYKTVMQQCASCRTCGQAQMACQRGGIPQLRRNRSSCAAYGCRPYDPARGCQCNVDCAKYSTCCPDYAAQCSGRATSTSGLAPTVAPTTGMPTPVPAGSARPAGAYVNNYDAGNPLRIHVDPARDNNYFLIIGDWGKAFGPGPCQSAVAEKMSRYVERQKLAGNNLLFIGSVGDNFYWSGVSTEMWETQWANVYKVWDPKSSLYHVPWLCVLGNHDLGDTDPYALCPHKARPGAAVINGQRYASNQFNADRNPGRPDHGCTDPCVARQEPGRCSRNTSMYWMPDYNWHYELLDASLEVIGIDTNYHAIDMLGGDARGHAEAFHGCGGRHVVQAHLDAVSGAARDLLVARAEANAADTVVIMQHYPRHCMKDIFEAALPAARRGIVKVLCAYGHVHDQKCEGYDPETGVCTMVLTGGGGGCCRDDVNLGGFTSVHLTAGGGFVADVSSDSVRMPFGQCMWSEKPVQSGESQAAHRRKHDFGRSF